jgi:DtxR family Mn-dependent transcriptional regulator
MTKEYPNMPVSESAQELLEKLWIAAEESHERIENDQLSAGEVDELVGLDLVRLDGGYVTLTTAGKSEAAQAVRRHRLAERLLVDVLATQESLMDEQACRFEHVLIDGVAESICTLLGHPRFCPHGKVIPPGECCTEMQESVDRLIAPLSDMQPDERGRIAYIRMNDPKRLQKLMAMGVLPGVPVVLLRRLPTFVFEAGYSQFAVDKEIASDVYVRLEETPLPHERNRRRRRRGES